MISVAPADTHRISEANLRTFKFASQISSPSVVSPVPEDPAEDEETMGCPVLLVLLERLERTDSEVTEDDLGPRGDRGELDHLECVGLEDLEAGEVQLDGMDAQVREGLLAGVDPLDAMELWVREERLDLRALREIAALLAPPAKPEPEARLDPSELPARREPTDLRDVLGLRVVLVAMEPMDPPVLLALLDATESVLVVPKGPPARPVRPSRSDPRRRSSSPSSPTSASWRRRQEFRGVRLRRSVRATDS